MCICTYVHMYKTEMVDRMIFKHEPDCIPWNGDIPEELQRMLVDYVAIANHLLALGLHHKVSSYQELRDLGKDWFVKY